MAAIIFDFDGVIADSEALANTILAEHVTRLGRPLAARGGRVVERSATELSLTSERVRQIQVRAVRLKREAARALPGSCR